MRPEGAAASTPRREERADLQSPAPGTERVTKRRERIIVLVEVSRKDSPKSSSAANAAIGRQRDADAESAHAARELAGRVQRAEDRAAEQRASRSRLLEDSGGSPRSADR
eukprot:5781428-Prymnesium_polylepis.1